MPTTEEKAKAEYRTATPAAKKVLETIFGSELFAGKIQDRVTSFETAYPLFLKKKFKDKLFLILQKRKLDELTATDKLMIIAEVLRGDWIPDYANKTQKKWWAYFVWNEKVAGFGFSCTVFVIAYSLTSVGSRLVFENSEMAKYFGSHPPFLKLHNEHLIINR